MRALLVLGMVVAGGAALAEPPRGTYIRVPAPERPAGLIAPAPSSRIIYMHRCTVGCQITAGNTDDSRTNTSSIAMGDRTIGAFTQSEAVWQALMKCMRETYAPFDVTITDVDPGNVPHYEEIVGGRPSDLRNDINNAGGVAPFTCNEIPNAISYTFDVYGPDPESLCWTAAQETAHAFGLEHEFLQKDPMTYLGGVLPKRFRAVQAACGEGVQRPCSCPGRVTQSSYQMIVDLFGPGAPSPPEVAITKPVDHKKVQPGFEVRATATDETLVDRVELWIDGAMVAMSKTEPYVFTAPADLSLGEHAIEARAVDLQGTPASAIITIEQGPPCTQSSGCSSPDVCVQGTCIPGPDTPGGIGSVCQADSECLSGMCANGGEQFMHCVAPCDPGNAASCPTDFQCLQAGTAGVCYPVASSGCCDAGGNPRGALLLGLGVGVLLLRRRR